ncbi:MAG: ATP-dependent DNA helicase RecG, partial [Bacteroidetes bacterium]|nr:ATP-dependent DNA helicase RecG [Bacteroidota bacterium]
EYILKAHNYTAKTLALRHIHRPETLEQTQSALDRLKFEELFYMQLGLLIKKQHRKQSIKGRKFEIVGELFLKYYETALPFELTSAQKRVLREIRNDIGSGLQMNRLLQGDVGSGKTMVALLSCLIAIGNKSQACLVAPTEILAQQHFEDLSSQLVPLGIKVELLTGSTSKKDRKEIHQALLSGALHLLIGTHAIFEEQVVFCDLGLAIIDEQHRFGVAQRSKLWRKAHIPPHILVMTATPIPRTLAMSVYGDLDVSVIDELPPGRTPIITTHRNDGARLRIFSFLKEQIALGRQIYVVYPLIKESEALDYKDLMDGYESISREFPAPQYAISILHGQMSAEAKNYEMRQFERGVTQIMVATTVIEVGVNVPNATVMVIESAERFGLAQLHQLRGRVGRGTNQSYCLLMTKKQLSDDAMVRMTSMVKHSSGFELSEIDLRLRGPGDIMGTQQSGSLQLKFADLIEDGELLFTVRSQVQQILENDPDLKNSIHDCMLKPMHMMLKGKILWSYIS